jgi:hypothetical protein
MQIVTTRSDGSAVKKPFTWSYSRLKNFESCPKRHFHIDIEKSVKEEESEQLLWGNEVHDALAKRLKSKTTLPVPMRSYEPWCVKIEKEPGEILVEQKLAIRKDFGPTTFFAKDVWFRAVGDVIKLSPSGAVALIADWKTGKIVEDSQQLALSAACVFAHYPSVQAVRSEFIWLKEDATTRGTFKRSDMPGMWRGLWPRIEALEAAHDACNYPPKPGSLCRKWCPVSKCPHHGT